MALDPSIVLQSQPVRVPNPLEFAQTAMALKNLGLQNQSQQVALAQHQRQLKDAQTIADLYRANTNPDGTVNHTGVVQGLAQAGLGDQIPAYQKQVADADKEQTAAAAAKFDYHKKQLDVLSNFYGTYALNPNATTQDVVQGISQLTQQYPDLFPPEQGAAAARELPGDPATLHRYLVSKAMQTQDMGKQIESWKAMAPQYNAQDRGAVINEGTIDPLTGVRTPGKDVAKSMTPDEKAKIDLQKSGGLSDDTKDFLADRILNGEKVSSVAGNLGRGAQGAADLRDIQNRVVARARDRGISAEQLGGITQDFSAAGRTLTELGAREGKIAPRVQEAVNFANIAKDASAAVPRGSFLPWTKLSQMSDTQLNDPALAKLKAATVSLINAYAAAVGGGQIHVHDQEQAGKLLSAAQSPEAYNAVVDQLLTEAQGALNAPGQVQDRIRGMRPGPGSPSGTPTPAQKKGAVAPVTTSGASVSNW